MENGNNIRVYEVLLLYNSILFYIQRKKISWYNKLGTVLQNKVSHQGTVAPKEQEKWCPWHQMTCTKGMWAFLVKQATELSSFYTSVYSSTQNVFLKQLLIFGLSDTKNKYIKHETVFLHFPKLHIGTHAKIIAIHIIQYR